MLWFGQGHLSPAWNERVTRALVAVVAALYWPTLREAAVRGQSELKFRERNSKMYMLEHPFER